MIFSRRHLIWLVPCLSAAYQQDATDNGPRLEYQFFSGRVDDFTDASLTVSRELASRKHEVRSFVRTSETFIKGELKKGVKVTVAFTTVDGSHIAHRVLIRS